MPDWTERAEARTVLAQNPNAEFCPGATAGEEEEPRVLPALLSE